MIHTGSTSVHEITASSGEKISLIACHSPWDLSCAETKPNGAGDRKRSSAAQFTKEELEEGCFLGISKSPILGSPEAFLSFSPPEGSAKERSIRLNHALRELVQSEEIFCKNLYLLDKYYIEPLLLRCTALTLECTPLLNSKTIITGVWAHHWKFFKSISRNPTVKNCANLIEALLGSSCYAQHEINARLLLGLIERQISPFNSGFVREIQRFLEQNQPKDRNMDLSILLLLQKPLARVGKYKIFLHMFKKLSADIKDFDKVTENINKKLLDIEAEIGKNRMREEELENVEALSNARAHGLDLKFYGLILKKFKSPLIRIKAAQNVVWESRVCRISLFERHLLAFDHSTRSLVFILPYRSCELGKQENQNSEDGIVVIAFGSIKWSFDIEVSLRTETERKSLYETIQKSYIIDHENTIWCNNAVFLVAAISLALERHLGSTIMKNSAKASFMYPKTRRVRERLLQVFDISAIWKRNV